MTRTSDRAFLLGALLTATAFAVSTVFIYEVAPVEATMGIVQKIFYVHVPAALATYAGFIACAVASAIYLIRPPAPLGRARARRRRGRPALLRLRPDLGPDLGL